MGSLDADESHIDPAFAAALDEGTAALGLEVTQAQRLRMWAHFQRVVEANRRFNLTRITSPAEAAVKHYADSLSLLAMPGASGVETSEGLRVLDVGTGAGFPAVPLAIVRGRWSITAIDGTGKKARFVAEAAAALGLSNLQVMHARAADLATVHRRDAGATTVAFDLVVLRAVMPLARGLAEVRPLLAPGGSAVFYKTARITQQELAEGARQAARQGLREEPSFGITLSSPEGPLERRLIRYRHGSEPLRPNRR